MRRNQLSVLAVDFVGGATATSFVLVFLWLTFVRGDSTAERVGELRGAVATVRQDLGRAQADRDRLQTLLVSEKAELGRAGRLPDRAPVEEYFQTLSRLATKLRLRVVRQNPLPSRSYPGLFERRYSYHVVGTAIDLMRLFQAIEAADYWADVSYFKITPWRGSGSEVTAEHITVLTVSLFSGLSPGEVGRNG